MKTMRWLSHGSSFQVRGRGTELRSTLRYCVAHIIPQGRQESKPRIATLKGPLYHVGPQTPPRDASSSMVLGGSFLFGWEVRRWN